MLRLAFRVVARMAAELGKDRVAVLDAQLSGVSAVGAPDRVFSLPAVRRTGQRRLNRPRYRVDDALLSQLEVGHTDAPPLTASGGTTSL